MAEKSDDSDFISTAEASFPRGQQEDLDLPPVPPVQETSGGNWADYIESMCSMLLRDSQVTLRLLNDNSRTALGTTTVVTHPLHPQESTNMGIPQELVINRLPLLTPWFELQPVPAIMSEQRPPRAHTHQFLDFGARGEVQGESEGTFRWRFDLYGQYGVEDIVGVSSPEFTNQFGDRVYARLYINSDGCTYQANAVSIFLVTVARRKNSLSPINYQTTIFFCNGYFSLVPMDPHTAFSLGRDDSIIRAVYGCQNCVSVTELVQSITSGTVSLGIQFLV